MSGILEKLNSYQLLTNFLPGVFFCFMLKFIGKIYIPTTNMGEEILMYYFVGLIINRVGSLIIAPALKKIHFLHYTSHADFINAEAVDPKIGVLSETNNFFRSLLTGVILLPFVVAVKHFTIIWPWFSENWKWLVLIMILLLFLFSYRKQSRFVSQRVMVVSEKVKTRNENEKTK